MSIAIRVEGLSKAYRLGELGTGTISRDLERWWATKVRGKEDPFRRIGEFSKPARKGTDDTVWALSDVSFDVHEGDVLGIIGRNGAGKSTLLKILSRTTSPTSGSVKINGRIASLLEVGTGFHPELTGRENIFLNGAILGMRKQEIARKFDEIVDFSGVERHIDTPVKRYSSGMYVRLAFAVAAHLEPEILIVDEVLAVGDAEFQRKCIGKLEDVSKHGRTVLFVSHNMQAISTLTRKGLLLDHGNLVTYDETSSVIRRYLESNAGQQGSYMDASVSESPRIAKVEIATSEPNYVHVCGKPITFEFWISLPQQLRNGAFSLQIVNSMDQPIVHCWIFNSETPVFQKAGMNRIRCTIPKLRLYYGRYKLRLVLADNAGSNILQMIDDAGSFEVEMFNIYRDYKWEPNACAYLEENVWEIDNDNPT